MGVSAFPSGWSTKTIDDLAEVIGGSTPSTENRAYWGGDIPWATPSDVTELQCRYISATKIKITPEGLANAAVSLLPKRSLLVTSRATIGYCAINTVPMTTNQGFASLVPKNGIDCEFLYYLISSLRSKLEKLSSGSTFVELGRTQFRKVTVAVPPEAVQLEIARILNSTDEAIEATRAVIEQARQLKTALLDQLILKGLPGKRTTLVKYHLGELFSERKDRGKRGLPTFSITMDGGMVNRETMERRIVSGLTPEEHLLVRRGDIAYNTMRMWQGVFGLALCDGIVSPAYVVLKPASSINSRYASYLFSHRTTIRKFERFSQGLTKDRLRLYYDEFAPISVEIPDLDTQQTIATTLQAVDDRVEVEEMKLEALTTLKAALSQGLLTGKIPVSNPAAKSASNQGGDARKTQKD